MYKLIVLAPSAGGKSSLMRYLRAHTKLKVAETDELVMQANGGTFPTGDLKDKVLIPQATRDTIARSSVVYIAGYIPIDLVSLARTKGFKVILLDLPLAELRRRNVQRMATEHYADAGPWFDMQLKFFNELREKGLIDEILDGNLPTETLAMKIKQLAEDMSTR